MAVNSVAAVIKKIAKVGLPANDGKQIQITRVDFPSTFFRQHGRGLSISLSLESWNFILTARLGSVSVLFIHWV